MADDVVIGSASVQIVGDYSGLEKSFTASQQLAQQAGQKISAAFESSVSSAKSLTTAADAVSASIADLASKSGLAGGELNIFRAALQGSLDSGVSVNKALEDIAASSSSLGVAVAAAAQGLQQETQAAAAAVGGNDALGDSFKRVRNDAEALEAAWEKAIEEDKKLADAARRDAAAFQQAWSDAIKENNARAQAEFQRFADGVGNFISHPLQAAGAAVRNFMLELGPMGVAALGGAAALAAVGAELFSLVKEFGAAAEATQNMADRLNLTFQETRNLEEMAQIAGVSITGLQQASFRLAESLEGTSANGAKVAKALGDIGVAGETSGELLTGFLQKLAEIPDDTKRIALAHEVLGKSSQQILPLIKNYAELQEAVKSLGPQIDENMAKKLTAADDALDKLSISWKRFKEEIAVFAAPAVQGFVDTLTAFVAGGIVKTLDQQIAEVEAKMVSLGEKSALAGWLMADGFTKGKNAELELLKAQREHLVGVEQAIERSRQYNAEIAKSNAAAKAASQPGLVQSIIDKQKELTQAVKDAHAAYETLHQAYLTGTPLANGYAVTSGDVARALANMTAAEAAASLTKAEHTKETEKFSKALRPAAENVAIFVRELDLMRAAHQKLISEAAEFSNTFGKAYTVADVAAIKAAAATTTLRLALEELGDENVKFTGNADKVAPLMDEIAKSMNEVTKAALQAPAIDKMQASLKALGIPVEEFGKKVRVAKDDAAEFVAANSDDMGHVTIAWQRMNSEVGRLASVNLPAAISMQEELISSMNRMKAPIGQIYDAQEKEYELEIRMKTQRGQSANSAIVGLTNIRLQQQALITSTQILGLTYQKLMGQVDQAFMTMGANIAQMIMQGENFWDVWHKTLNSIEQQLLTTVIQAILKMAEAWIINLILGVAAEKTAGSSEIATAAAIGGANAAASTAAIPIIGPALALEAGLGMYASILGTFIPLAIAGFSQGGMVPEDMFAMVHKGEYVLPAEKAAQAMLGGGDKPSGGGETHLHFDFSGAHFTNGISDNQVASIFNRGFRLSKLAGALPPGRFPQ